MTALKKLDTVKLISFVGIAISGIATLIANYANEKQMEKTIEEKVNEALAERDKTEES